MKFGNFLLMVAMVFMLTGVTFAMNQDQAAGDSTITVPQGPALTEGEVVILLQAKVPVEIIQKFVQTRGAGFPASKDIGKRIISAGGNVALVGTISLNQREAASFDTDPRRNGKK